MRLETALEQFMRKVDIIVSLEMGGKIDAETAYKNIKVEVKELKRLRKIERNSDHPIPDPLSRLCLDK